MGKTDGKIFCLILFLISGLFLPLFSNDGSGTAASLTNFALPEYQKESGRLQFIIYGEKATNLGAMVELIKPKIDIVRNDVKNINDVVSLAHILPYPLYSKVPQVLAYWKDKAHSQALIFTDIAEYDKNLRMLRSDAPVRFRSREIAIDGVGFDADQDRKFIHIRSKVRMVIYPELRKKSGISFESEQKEQNKK